MSRRGGDNNPRRLFSLQEGMDDDIRNLSFLYHQSPRNNLGLNLMPNVAMERETKNFLPNEMLFHRNMPISHIQDMSWLQPREKVMPMFSFGHHSFQFPENPRPLAVQTPHMIQDEAKDGKPSQVDGPHNGKDAKKKPQNSTPKALKPRKPKKVPTPKSETGSSAPRSRPERKNTDIVINGLDLDISVIPTPVCTCTGTPCTCYRWGMGGWQSACCTNSMSTYPLPMSTKRRGARIAGRKMSQGAFKKVLEKLAGEGYNLSNPIDLRNFWAKHGTNKFVTIR